LIVAVYQESTRVNEAVINWNRSDTHEASKERVGFQ
jgi:hypothetical protein